MAADLADLEFQSLMYYDRNGHLATLVASSQGEACEEGLPEESEEVHPVVLERLALLV